MTTGYGNPFDPERDDPYFSRMILPQDNSVGPGHRGTAGLTPSDQGWSEIQILLEESKVWKENGIERSEPQRGSMRLSVGPASVGTALPRRVSRIPVHTGRRHLSRRFDRQEIKKSEGSEMKEEERSDPSPIAPSQDVS